MKSFAQIMEDIGSKGQLIAEDGAMDIINHWWIYFAGVGAKSSWHKMRLHWHSFSFGCMPSMSYTAAFKAFAAESPNQSVYLFSGEDRRTVLKILKHKVSNAILNKVIAGNKCVIDLYVVNTDFEWTFVRTHEESIGIGPFYSRSDWLHKWRRSEA